MFRALALVIAGIGFAAAGGTGVDFILSYADWYWWLLLWIALPILTIITLAVTLGVGVMGADKTKSLGVGAAAGIFAGGVVTLVVFIGLGMSLLETWFLYKAFENAPDVSSPDMQNFWIFLALFVLNMIRGMITRSSSNKASSS
jgi:hypothetical protein